jgi:hypothetical protein
MTTKKMPVFNKKNTLALADLIYSDKKGAVSFLKLCNGILSNGVDGGRTTHCAVGEVYYTFVNHNMGNVNRVDATEHAIDALLKVAKLKTKSNYSKLKYRLDYLVNLNDKYGNAKSNEVYIERAKNVADVLCAQIAPLLK